MRKNIIKKIYLSTAILLGCGVGSAVLQPANILIPAAQAQEQAESATEPLFAPGQSPEEFAAVRKQAEKDGVSQQILLEADLLHALFNQDKAGLVAQLQSLKEIGSQLKIEGSHFFESQSDYDSLVEGISALKAEQENDDDAFEQHIKQALWLGPPPLQDIYLGWMNERRSAIAMQKVTVPLDTKLRDSDGKETTLKAAMGDNKAMLIDFWAEWCAPCMNAMDELKTRGTILAPQKVAVVGLNIEDDGATNAIEIAARVKKDFDMSLPWLVEPTGLPYSHLLNVDTIPRAVLVSAEGKVLFSGHPADPALLAALQEIGATL